MDKTEVAQPPITDQNPQRPLAEHVASQAADSMRQCITNAWDAGGVIQGITVGPWTRIKVMQDGKVVAQQLTDEGNQHQSYAVKMPDGRRYVDIIQPDHADELLTDSHPGSAGQVEGVAKNSDEYKAVHARLGKIDFGHLPSCRSQQYTPKVGDTLTSIVHNEVVKSLVSEKKIADLYNKIGRDNHIDPNKIFVGKPLTLPVPFEIEDQK